MQKRLVLVCEDSLCPRKQPDVSGPGLGEAGCHMHLSFGSIPKVYLKILTTSSLILPDPKSSAIGRLGIP